MMDKKQSQSIGSEADKIPDAESLRQRAEENAQINHPGEPIIRADDVEQARQEILGEEITADNDAMDRPSPLVGRVPPEAAENTPNVPEEQQEKLRKLAEQGVEQAAHEKHLSGSEENPETPSA